MTNFKLMVTPDGKHPASKWGEVAADEIIEISAEAPETLMREAMMFRASLLGMMTRHHQAMMDHEQEQIRAGKTDMDLPYETEEYAEKVVAEIVALAKNTSFENHFQQDLVHQHLREVCNRNFKSAKLVERSHFNTEKAKVDAAAGQKKGKKS